MDYNVINCPHCNDLIIIYNNEINCRIFRHAIYKNGDNVNPHTTKEECDRLVQNGEIYGCGKPFQLDDNNQPFICDYI